MALAVAPIEPNDGRSSRPPEQRPSPEWCAVTALGTATTVLLGALLVLLLYAAAAYVVLFYLLGDERLGTGIAVDAAYAFTVPFVLSVTWLRTWRGP